MIEHADAVVVGARCAGSATAIALARAGRRVVALDRVAFPADTVSTHLLFPSGVAEVARLGALDRVRALGAPPMPEALVGGAGLAPRGRFSPVDGIDYAMCVRRTGLDAALVETAREAGADVRERVKVTDLVWDAGRVAGVRYEDADGEEGELRAPLVVGADGRRSTVARLVGARAPYRQNPNGRACFYAYFADGRPEWRGVAAQWREGPELATAFPCDDGLVLVLLMPPVERAAEFRADLRGAFARTVASMPALAERLAGCEMVSKVRAATAASCRAGSPRTGATASPSSRPKRSASRMPCAVTGSLKWPASPGSAQPGPDERRKYDVVSVAERTFVTGSQPSSRLRRPGSMSTVRSNSPWRSPRNASMRSTGGMSRTRIRPSSHGNAVPSSGPSRHCAAIVRQPPGCGSVK